MLMLQCIRNFCVFVNTQKFIIQQTFDTCIVFQFQSWLETEYLVDKWYNQYMDIGGGDTFGQAVYY